MMRRLCVALLALVACRVVEKPAGGGAPDLNVLRVFYGTDRKPTGRHSPGNYFGADRSDLSYGVCEVSVPRDHRMGRYEIRWGRREPRVAPETHVLLLSLVPKGAEPFFGELRAAAQGKAAFVFLHGYNVSFEDAVRRTAQMAYDLGFDGVPLTYSWPSRAEVTGYLDDEAAVAKTVPHLRGFLLDVARRSGASAVHVIAHSMGNRALLAALETFGTPAFGEIVCAAPDVDRDVFLRSAPAVAKGAARLTLYASSRDLALVASREIHRAGRAGDSGEGLLILAGVDSIDVSAVDTSLLGHSYYGDNRSVISDLGVLLRERTPPSARPRLASRKRGALEYWEFLP